MEDEGSIKNMHFFLEKGCWTEGLVAGNRVAAVRMGIGRPGFDRPEPGL